MSKKALSLLVMMLIICVLLTSCAAWNYLSKDEASKEGSDSREKFFVEIAPLRNYYPAEAYHQDYLKKNPRLAGLLQTNRGTGDNKTGR